MAAPRSRSLRVSERMHGNCSEAYLWLRVRHRRLLVRMTGRYPPYREVAAEMVAEGVRGGRGRILTEKAVRRMWLRVCRDIACDADTRAPRRPAAPAHWRPTEAASPPMKRVLPAPRAGPSTAGTAAQEIPSAGDARIQAALDEAARRSGR